MTAEEKQTLTALSQQLSTAGKDFYSAQTELEHTIKTYGISSSQTAQASQLCSDLALVLSQLEVEYSALLAAKK